MAYSTSTPARLIQQAISEQSNRLWALEGTDAAATVNTTGYITNGGALGMKVNDLLRYSDTNLGITTNFRVVTVSSTYPGAVDLDDGTVIGSATNSD